MLKRPSIPNFLPTLTLLALAAGIGSVFVYLRSRVDLKSLVPEVLALLLGAGLLYVIAAYIVQRFALGVPALVVIIGGALAFRILALPIEPTLSADVYRYQWEGRVQRAGINPYTTYPAALRRLPFEDPEHPLETGTTVPTLYPPLSEFSFAWMKTISGYKRLYTGLDVASLVLLLLLLAIRGQPLHRVLIYAWNPSVVVAFAMCAHHDSLAILTLLAANLLIIRQRGTLSIFFLALSFLSKFFSGLILPVFLSGVREKGQTVAILSEAKDPGNSSSKRHRVAHRSASGSRWAYGALFLAVISAGYVPYASAGRKLLDGLAQYASGWENNDSLFRLLLLAGNSRPQAGLIAGVFLAALSIYVLKRRLEPLRASFALIGGLLLLSPNAFPWYFAWSIPFLCFYPNASWLLLSVTCVLGYAPLVGHAAGLPYRDSPLMLALEYAPAIALLGLQAGREIADSRMETGASVHGTRHHEV